jgi:hypothetical protein
MEQGIGIIKRPRDTHRQHEQKEQLFKQPAAALAFAIAGAAVSYLPSD